MLYPKRSNEKSPSAAIRTPAAVRSTDRVTWKLGTIETHLRFLKINKGPRELMWMWKKKFEQLRNSIKQTHVMLETQLNADCNWFVHSISCKVQN